MKFLYQKYKYTCGPAAIINAIKFLSKKNFTEKRVSRIALTATGEGTNNGYLEEAIVKLKYEPILYCPANFKILDKWTSRGFPVIVEYQGERGGHYAVVVAVTKRYIILIDSAVKKSNQFKIYEKSEFYKRWHNYKKKWTRYRWAIVVVNK